MQNFNNNNDNINFQSPIMNNINENNNNINMFNNSNSNFNINQPTYIDIKEERQKRTLNNFKMLLDKMDEKIEIQ